MIQRHNHSENGGGVFSTLCTSARFKAIMAPVEVCRETQIWPYLSSNALSIRAADDLLNGRLSQQGQLAVAALYPVRCPARRAINQFCDD